MDTILSIIIIFHFIGLAAIVGGFLSQLGRNSRFDFKWLFIGALLQLVTGVALVGFIEMNDGSLNHMKIGIKLLLTIIAFVAVLMGRSKQSKILAAGGEERSVKPFLHAAGGAAFINIIIAVLW